MIVLLILLSGINESWGKFSWDNALFQLESTTTKIKDNLTVLNKGFSVSDTENIPVLEMENALYSINTDLRSLKEQIIALEEL